MVRDGDIMEWINIYLHYVTIYTYILYQLYMVMKHIYIHTYTYIWNIMGIQCFDNGNTWNI